MAVRSIAQLKAWFKRGLYPTAVQFADWMDSYWHKEEQIPISSVDNLSNQLNDKYAKTDGVELERKHEQLVVDFHAHEQSNANDFDGVYKSVKKLKDEDVLIWTDIEAIREIIKSGATLAEAKAALVALGSNYKDLYAVAGTLKAFLEANDTVDITINTWTEIEAFLQGITDSQSLTSLLNALETTITGNYNTVIEQVNAAITEELEGKLDKTDIVNDLVTGGADKVLSAEQGSVLSIKIDAMSQNMGGKMVSINQNVLNLLETSTSDEIFNAFENKESFIEIVVKTTGGAPLAANVMGLLMPLMKFGGEINEEQGRYTLSFIYLSPMNANGGEMFLFEMTAGIISLIRSKTNIGYTDVSNMLMKSNLVSDPTVGGTDKPASADAVKRILMPDVTFVEYSTNEINVPNNNATIYIKSNVYSSVVFKTTSDISIFTVIIPNKTENGLPVKLYLNMPMVPIYETFTNAFGCQKVTFIRLLRKDEDILTHEWVAYS